MNAENVATSSPVLPAREPISNELDYLTKARLNLEDVILDLREQLNDVLRPDPNMKGKDVSEDPQPVSPMNNRIASLKHHVLNLQTIVEDTTDRLDLNVLAK